MSENMLAKKSPSGGCAQFARQFKVLAWYVYAYIYLHVYVIIYMYIYRRMSMYRIDISLHIHKFSWYMHMYIFIYIKIFEQIHVYMFIYIQEKCGLKTEKLADFNYRDPRACYHHTGPWLREAGMYIC
jgi:hypothetical protein